MNMKFTVHGQPIPQGSINVFGGRAVPVNSKKLREWRNQIVETAEPHIPHNWDNQLPVIVTVIFHFQRPPSHLTTSGTLTKRAPRNMINRPDLDKLIRAVGDALTDAGIVHDDSRILEWHATKTYTTESSRMNLLVAQSTATGLG